MRSTAFEAGTSPRGRSLLPAPIASASADDLRLGGGRAGRKLGLVDRAVDFVGARGDRRQVLRAGREQQGQWQGNPEHELSPLALSRQTQNRNTPAKAPPMNGVSQLIRAFLKKLSIHCTASITASICLVAGAFDHEAAAQAPASR